MSDEEPEQVTGAHLGPFLKVHPEAKIQVIVGDLLVAVTDAYYDNETGAIVLELDPRIEFQEENASTAPDQ